MSVNYLHGMNLSDGDDESAVENNRLAVGLQCFNKRFSYSGLNILLKSFEFVLIDLIWVSVGVAFFLVYY